MTADLHDAVRAEIEALHELFVGWFAGSIPESSFATDFLERMSDDVVLIPPAGHWLGLDELAASIREGYGSNPDFRIAIREVRVLRDFDGYVLATYEEWQRNALASTPADNGRVATVLFEGSGPFRWLHIHETWLPAEKMAAGPYDF